jgi:transposase InsO family protein
LTALEAAELHFDHTFKRFGLPEDIISDRDPLFVSKTYRSLMKLCGVKQRISTAYHPQTDGETERVNRELETYLRIFCKRIPEDWDKNLSIAEFAYNGRPHSVTK